MELVFMVEPERDREEELRAGLLALPCQVDVQALDGRWLVRVVCEGWDSIRAEMAALARRFPGATGLGSGYPAAFG